MTSKRRSPSQKPSIGRAPKALALGVALATLAACGDTARLLANEDTGSSPTLPEPVKRLIPTVNIAPAKGWPAGVMPTPMAGLTVTALADKLDHPRWVYVLPNGDALVADDVGTVIWRGSATK